MIQLKTKDELEFQQHRKSLNTLSTCVNVFKMLLQNIKNKSFKRISKFSFNVDASLQRYFADDQ